MDMAQADEALAPTISLQTSLQPLIVAALLPVDVRQVVINERRVHSPGIEPLNILR